MKSCSGSQAPSAGHALPLVHLVTHSSYRLTLVSPTSRPAEEQQPVTLSCHAGSTLQVGDFELSAARFLWGELSTTSTPTAGTFPKVLPRELLGLWSLAHRRRGTQVGK